MTVFLRSQPAERTGEGVVASRDMRQRWRGPDGPSAICSDLLVEADRVFEIAFGPTGITTSFFLQQRACDRIELLLNRTLRPKFGVLEQSNEHEREGLDQACQRDLEAVARAHDQPDDPREYHEQADDEEER